MTESKLQHFIAQLDMDVRNRKRINVSDIEHILTGLKYWSKCLIVSINVCIMQHEKIVLLLYRYIYLHILFFIFRKYKLSSLFNFIKKLWQHVCEPESKR